MMPTMRISMAVCATVLLAAGLSGQFANAAGRLSSIKALITGKTNFGKDYVALAEHLFKTTPSVELAENTKAARENKRDVSKLALAFGALKGDSGDPESSCGKENLANLRLVAEGVRDGGNLGPEEITGAVLRLNNIVIKAAENAFKVCNSYLTAKWPKAWQPNFSDPAMKVNIDSLTNVLSSFSYEGFVNRATYPLAEILYQTNSISSVIRDGARRAGKPIKASEQFPLFTESKSVIAMQLEEYFYRPCREFVSFNEAREVLAPFNDMLMSWSLVNSDWLSKFYMNEAAFHVSNIKSVSEPDRQLVEAAHSLQTCERFLSTPAKKLANRISKVREEENAELFD